MRSAPPASSGSSGDLTRTSHPSAAVPHGSREAPAGRTAPWRRPDGPSARYGSVRDQPCPTSSSICGRGEEGKSSTRRSISSGGDSCSSHVLDRRHRGRHLLTIRTGSAGRHHPVGMSRAGDHGRCPICAARPTVDRDGSQDPRVTAASTITPLGRCAPGWKTRLLATCR